MGDGQPAGLIIDLNNKFPPRPQPPVPVFTFETNTYGLTREEFDVLGYMARAYTNGRIAETLGMLPGHVHRCMITIFQKLGVYGDAQSDPRSRAILVYYGINPDRDGTDLTVNPPVDNQESSVEQQTENQIDMAVSIWNRMHNSTRNKYVAAEKQLRQRYPSGFTSEQMFSEFPDGKKSALYRMVGWWRGAGILEGAPATKTGGMYKWKTASNGLLQTLQATNGQLGMESDEMKVPSEDKSKGLTAGEVNRMSRKRRKSEYEMRGGIELSDADLTKMGELDSDLVRLIPLTGNGDSGDGDYYIPDPSPMKFSDTSRAVERDEIIVINNRNSKPVVVRGEKQLTTASRITIYRTGGPAPDKKDLIQAH